MRDNKGTDPYGKLKWCIGSCDDFWCFDFYDHRNGWVTLHAVVNSETGHFIQDAEPPVTVRRANAVEEAKRLTYEAMEWCLNNDVSHDQPGWDQDTSYFWRCVHSYFTRTGPAIRVPVKMAKRPVITSNYL